MYLVLSPHILALVKQLPLRITIIALNYTPEPTGNAPYTASLAEGLVAAGHSVRVLTGYPHYPQWQLKEGYSGWSMRENMNGVEVLRLRHHVPRRPNSLSRMHMELSFGVRLLFARWGKPQVVLVVSPALFSSGLAILRVRAQPSRPGVGIWVQDIYSRGVVETGTGGSGLARLAAAVEARILRSTDGVVAIHDRFQRFIVEALGVPSSKVRVIRNWTHLPNSPSLNRDATRSSLGWEANDIIVLHAGNMGKKQGLENVIEAGRLANEQGSRVRFVLLGDGNQRESLHSTATDGDRVQFLAPLPGEDFMAALAASDILLVNERPGVRDMAVPSKLTSYFNAGVPVIAATDAGSVTAEELAASGGGIRVDAGDPQALLDAAELMATDRAGSRAMGASGLRFRLETLSESSAIAHYDEFVTSLATPRGS